MTTHSLLGEQRKNRTWTAGDIAELRRLWDQHGGRKVKIAAIMGRSTGSIDGKSRVLGLQFHGGRARTMAPDDRAAIAGRTRFLRRVLAPDSHVLKSGDNQRKLGAVVKKGRWKGFPIFSLTLEERATCPRACALWLGCYGNGMHLAKRYAHGPALERQIAAELAALEHRHPGGFVVRLHILGDFYSAAYVEFWGEMLARHPALRVFGYTAWHPTTAIGAAVHGLRARAPERWAIRTSGAPAGFRTAVVANAADAPRGAIVCPAQLGKTQNCASCGLCWSEHAVGKAIAFLRH